MRWPPALASCTRNSPSARISPSRKKSASDLPDEGQLIVDGKAARFGSPSDAMAAGIGIVHQELAFCENLTVAENLCLGRLPARATFVSRREMLRRVRAYLAARHANTDTAQ